ncbi:MAG: hypothetical protein JSS51_13645 [Planctomycetes bacterium]|nr:hypothetical protein [Planctomycetota bacterium]
MTDDELAQHWLACAREPRIAAAIDGLHAMIADQVEARGPACWASGRCCHFEKTGHRLYVTGLEAALCIARLARPLKAESLRAAIVEGNCPFQFANTCSVHTVRPSGCRVYFCDRSAQDWQHELSERLAAEIRALHQRENIEYRYAEWRGLLGLFV